MLQFHVGDKVVYPNHGVGVVEQAVDADGEYYRLHIPSSNLRVLVPLANANAVGLRAVSAIGALAPVLAFLSEAAPPEQGAPARRDWKGRFKENAERLRGGSPLAVAEVLKGLAQLHSASHLSFREKKMLDRAATLLADELASAEALSFNDALAQVRASLATAGLDLPPFDDDFAAAS